MAPGDKLFEQIFNLKFMAKQMARKAAKCEKEEKTEKAKAMKAVQQGNKEGALIYAQNAIRKNGEQFNYLRLGSRLDAVVSRLQTAHEMNGVFKNMTGIVKSLEKNLYDSNLGEVTKIMDTFEHQFETLDVQSEYMENAMGSTTSLMVDHEKVTSFLSQAAEEIGLDISQMFPAAGASVLNTHQALNEMPAKKVLAEENSFEEDLSARLSALRKK